MHCFALNFAIIDECKTTINEKRSHYGWGFYVKYFLLHFIRTAMKKIIEITRQYMIPSV